MNNSNNNPKFTKEDFNKLFEYHGESCHCPDCGSWLTTLPFERLPENIKPYMVMIMKEEPYRNRNVEIVFCKQCLIKSEYSHRLN